MREGEGRVGKGEWEREGGQGEGGWERGGQGEGEILCGIIILSMPDTLLFISNGALGQNMKELS